jgi:hypothetical protein
VRADALAAVIHWQFLYRRKLPFVLDDRQRLLISRESLAHSKNRIDVSLIP